MCKCNQVPIESKFFQLGEQALTSLFPFPDGTTGMAEYVFHPLGFNTQRAANLRISMYTGLGVYLYLLDSDNSADAPSAWGAPPGTKSPTQAPLWAAGVAAGAQTDAEWWVYAQEGTVPKLRWWFKSGLWLVKIDVFPVGSCGCNGNGNGNGGGSPFGSPFGKTGC